MVIGLDARMNDEAGEFAGLTQEEANERIVARLESGPARVKGEPYRHAVATCDRCGSRIEPLVSLQWWCDMERAREAAIDVVGDGARPLPPDASKKVYLDWMESDSRPGASRGSSGGATGFRRGIARTGT